MAFLIFHSLVLLYLNTFVFSLFYIHISEGSFVVQVNGVNTRVTTITKMEELNITLKTLVKENVSDHMGFIFLHTVATRSLLNLFLTTCSDRTSNVEIFFNVISSPQ